MSGNNKEALQRENTIRFIEAAEELIDEYGIDNVSVRKIAEKAGFHNSTIYLYFKDVNELILLASMKHFNEYSKALARLSSKNWDSTENFYFVWRFFVESMLKNPKIYYNFFFGKHGQDFGSLFKRYYELFPEEADNIKNYSDACRVAIDHMDVDETKCNILIAHQFVTGASRSDSEEMIGGLDNVDVSVFDAFDYVALGHIHGPQRVGRDTVRYSGTPLKYSFSEANHHKSVTILDIEGKTIMIRTAPLISKHDMREISGTFEELTKESFYQDQKTDDYLHITVTDEEDIPDAMGKLRKIYPNLMKLNYDNTRTRQDQLVEKGADVEHKQPIELFEELYEMQNNQSMNEEQRAFVQDMMKTVWKE